MPATTAGAAPAPSTTDFAEKAIKDLHAAVKVDDGVLKEARDRRNLVNRHARDFDGALRTYNSGSVAAGVVIKKVDDADGGVVLDRRTYPELGPDGGGERPNEIVEDVAEFVIDKVVADYPNADYEIGRRSIKITFGKTFKGQDPYVDLIVALTRKDSDPGLWIPQTEDGIWDASDPEKHTALFTSKSIAKDLRVYRAQLVRIGKAMLKQDDEPAIASFHFGAHVLRHIKSDEPLPGTLIDGLQRVFDLAADEIDQGDTPDPAEVSAPLKLDLPRHLVVQRLDGFASGLQEAIEHRDDEDAVQEALAKILPDYIEAPKSSAKLNIARELRSRKPAAAVTSAFGVGAGATRTPRSAGDAPE